MKRREMRALTSGPRTKPLHVGGGVHFALMRDRTSEQKMRARLMSGGRWKRGLGANKSGLICGWGAKGFTVALVSNRLQPTGFPCRGHVLSLWLPTSVMDLQLAVWWVQMCCMCTHDVQGLFNYRQRPFDSWHHRHEFAHCGQLWMNRHILFLPFTDRQTQHLFLPLHKSRDCLHTLPTGTVPFIKEIYLQPSRGEVEHQGKMSSD